MSDPLCNIPTLIDSNNCYMGNCYMEGYSFDTVSSTVDESPYFTGFSSDSSVGSGFAHCGPSDAQNAMGYLSLADPPKRDWPGLDESPLYQVGIGTLDPAQNVEASVCSPCETPTPVTVKGNGVCAAQGERRKEQNRSAQRAYRERQRRLIDAYESEVETLKAANVQLKAKGDKLETKLLTLQLEMLMHFGKAHGMAGS